MNDIPTALIAEDEPLLAAGLQADLQRVWPQLHIVSVAANGRQALDQALQHQPDVCFLDIRMPGISGLEVAQALAEEWPDPAVKGGRPFPLLVFVTAFEQYAINAFEHQAADYLLKPVEPQRLSACAQRLQQRLSERQEKPNSTRDDTPPGTSLDASVAQLRALLGSLTPPAAPRLEVIQAQVGHIIHMVPVEDVAYFEAADKYVRVVTAEREHLVRTSLRELLPQLDAQRFWQIHRSVVVQVRSVSAALRDESGKIWLTLRDRPERLAVSRLYAHLFKGM